MEGGWLTPRPGRFIRGKDPVPIVQKDGWAPEPDWTGAENLAPTGIRSQDRPARSQSLYRLSYTQEIKTEVRLRSIREIKTEVKLRSFREIKTEVRLRSFREIKKKLILPR